MRTRIITFAIAALGVGSLSGLAISADNTSSAAPAPAHAGQIRPPAATASSTPVSTVDDHGIDNPATHEAGDDDHGDNSFSSRGSSSGPGSSATTATTADDHGVDNPATDDVGDDRGTGSPATTVTTVDDHGVDNAATHDVGDDGNGGGSASGNRGGGNGGPGRG